VTADPTLVLAILMAFAFALTNGFHDAANSIATLVATRIARPLPAVAMASVFNLLGPLFFGAAVANTVRSCGTRTPGAGACRRARVTPSSVVSSEPPSSTPGPTR
jgi:phosphate/sulfate permease